MMLDLNNNGVVDDNPFDLMIVHAIELLRDTLFGCHRIKNNRIPDGIATSYESLEKRYNLIINAYDQIMKLQPETVAMLRETSYFGTYEVLEPFNNSLLTFKNHYDYKMALFMHAFSWSFMILLPIFLYRFLHGQEISSWILVLQTINWFIHFHVDDLKANAKTINLIIDQSIHLFQILLTWVIFVYIN